MKVSTATCTMTGGRPYNEDSVRIFAEGTLLVATVADGLGGHGGGHIASSIVTEAVTELFQKSSEVDDANIQKIYQEANSSVLAAHTLSCQMKSTAVSLFVNRNSAAWAHVGDSRLYHFVNSKLVFQTKDHSVSQMAVRAGEITLSEIRFHEDRNKVLRALGNDAIIKTEISPVQLLSDEFHAFLLCSDGFWEYVLEEEMEGDLAKSSTPEEWLSLMIDRLEEKVAEDNDNYTAAAVFIATGKGND